MELSSISQHLSSLYDKSQFTDVSITIFNKTIRAHKSILTMSGLFNALINDPFTSINVNEKDQSSSRSEEKIHLYIDINPPPKNVYRPSQSLMSAPVNFTFRALETMVKYFYGFPLRLDHSFARSLLVTAAYFDVPQLMSAVSDYIFSGLSQSNVIDYLLLVHNKELGEAGKLVEDASLAYLLRNSVDIVDELYRLPLAYQSKLFSAQELYVKTEFHRYRMMLYVKREMRAKLLREFFYYHLYNAAINIISALSGSSLSCISSSNVGIGEVESVNLGLHAEPKSSRSIRSRKRRASGPQNEIMNSIKNSAYVSKDPLEKPSSFAKNWSRNYNSTDAGVPHPVIDVSGKAMETEFDDKAQSMRKNVPDKPSDLPNHQLDTSLNVEAPSTQWRRNSHRYFSLDYQQSTSDSSTADSKSGLHASVPIDLSIDYDNDPEQEIAAKVALEAAIADRFHLRDNDSYPVLVSLFSAGINGGLRLGGPGLKRLSELITYASHLIESTLRASGVPVTLEPLRRIGVNRPLPVPSPEVSSKLSDSPLTPLRKPSDPSPDVIDTATTPIRGLRSIGRGVVPDSPTGYSPVARQNPKTTLSNLLLNLGRLKESTTPISPNLVDFSVPAGRSPTGGVSRQPVFSSTSSSNNSRIQSDYLSKYVSTSQSGTIDLASIQPQSTVPVPGSTASTTASSNTTGTSTGTKEESCTDDEDMTLEGIANIPLPIAVAAALSAYEDFQRLIKLPQYASPSYSSGKTPSGVLSPQMTSKNTGNIDLIRGSLLRPRESIDFGADTEVAAESNSEVSPNATVVSSGIASPRNATVFNVVSQSTVATPLSTPERPIGSIIRNDEGGGLVRRPQPAGLPTSSTLPAEDSPERVSLSEQGLLEMIFANSDAIRALSHQDNRLPSERNGSMVEGTATWSGFQYRPNFHEMGHTNLLLENPTSLSSSLISSPVLYSPRRGDFTSEIEPYHLGTFVSNRPLGLWSISNSTGLFSLSKEAQPLGQPLLVETPQGPLLLNQTGAMEASTLSASSPTGTLNNLSRTFGNSWEAPQVPSTRSTASRVRECATSHFFSGVLPSETPAGWPTLQYTTQELSNAETILKVFLLLRGAVSAVAAVSGAAAALSQTGMLGDRLRAVQRQLRSILGVVPAASQTAPTNDSIRGLGGPLQEAVTRSLLAETRALQEALRPLHPSFDLRGLPPPPSPSLLYDRGLVEQLYRESPPGHVGWRGSSPAVSTGRAAFSTPPTPQHGQLPHPPTPRRRSSRIRSPNAVSPSSSAQIDSEMAQDSLYDSLSHSLSGGRGAVLFDVASLSSTYEDSMGAHQAWSSRHSSGLHYSGNVPSVGVRNEPSERLPLIFDVRNALHIPPPVSSRQFFLQTTNPGTGFTSIPPMQIPPNAASSQVHNGYVDIDRSSARSLEDFQDVPFPEVGIRSFLPLHHRSVAPSHPGHASPSGSIAMETDYGSGQGVNGGGANAPGRDALQVRFERLLLLPLTLQHIVERIGGRNSQSLPCVSLSTHLWAFMRVCVDSLGVLARPAAAAVEALGARGVQRLASLLISSTDGLNNHRDASSRAAMQFLIAAAAKPRFPVPLPMPMQQWDPSQNPDSSIRPAFSERRHIVRPADLYLLSRQISRPIRPIPAGPSLPRQLQIHSCCTVDGVVSNSSRFSETYLSGVDFSHFLAACAVDVVGSGSHSDTGRSAAPVLTPQLAQSLVANADVLSLLRPPIPTGPSIEGGLNEQHEVMRLFRLLQRLPATLRTDNAPALQSLLASGLPYASVVRELNNTLGDVSWYLGEVWDGFRFNDFSFAELLQLYLDLRVCLIYLRNARPAEGARENVIRTGTGVEALIALELGRPQLMQEALDLADAGSCDAFLSALPWRVPLSSLPPVLSGLLGPRLRLLLRGMPPPAFPSSGSSGGSSARSVHSLPAQPSVSTPWGSVISGPAPRYEQNLLSEGELRERGAGVTDPDLGLTYRSVRELLQTLLTLSHHVSSPAQSTVQEQSPPGVPASNVQSNGDLDVGIAAGVPLSRERVHGALHGAFRGILLQLSFAQAPGTTATRSESPSVSTSSPNDGVGQTGVIPVEDTLSRLNTQPSASPVPDATIHSHQPEWTEADWMRVADVCRGGLQAMFDIESLLYCHSALHPLSSQLTTPALNTEFPLSPGWATRFPNPLAASFTDSTRTWPMPQHLLQGPQQSHLQARIAVPAPNVIFDVLTDSTGHSGSVTGVISNVFEAETNSLSQYMQQQDCHYFESIGPVVRLLMSRVASMPFPMVDSSISLTHPLDRDNDVIETSGNIEPWSNSMSMSATGSPNSPGAADRRGGSGRLGVNGIETTRSNWTSTSGGSSASNTSSVPLVNTDFSASFNDGSRAIQTQSDSRKDLLHDFRGSEKEGDDGGWSLLGSVNSDRSTHQSTSAAFSAGSKIANGSVGVGVNDLDNHQGTERTEEDFTITIRTERFSDAGSLGSDSARQRGNQGSASSSHGQGQGRVRQRRRRRSNTTPTPTHTPSPALSTSLHLGHNESTLKVTDLLSDGSGSGNYNGEAVSKQKGKQTLFLSGVTQSTRAAIRSGMRSARSIRAKNRNGSAAKEAISSKLEFDMSSDGVEQSNLLANVNQAASNLRSLLGQPPATPTYEARGGSVYHVLLCNLGQVSSAVAHFSDSDVNRFNSKAISSYSPSDLRISLGQGASIDPKGSKAVNVTMGVGNSHTPLANAYASYSYSVANGLPQRISASQGPVPHLQSQSHSQTEGESPSARLRGRRKGKKTSIGQSHEASIPMEGLCSFSSSTKSDKSLEGSFKLLPSQVNGGSGVGVEEESHDRHLIFKPTSSHSSLSRRLLGQHGSKIDQSENPPSEHTGFPMVEENDELSPQGQQRMLSKVYSEDEDEKGMGTSPERHTPTAHHLSSTNPGNGGASELLMPYSPSGDSQLLRGQKSRRPVLVNSHLVPDGDTRGIIRSKVRRSLSGSSFDEKESDLEGEIRDLDEENYEEEDEGIGMSDAMNIDPSSPDSAAVRASRARAFDNPTPLSSPTPNSIAGSPSAACNASTSPSNPSDLLAGGVTNASLAVGRDGEGFPHVKPSNPQMPLSQQSRGADLKSGNRNASSNLRRITPSGVLIVDSNGGDVLYSSLEHCLVDRIHSKNHVSSQAHPQIFSESPISLNPGLSGAYDATGAIQNSETAMLLSQLYRASAKNIPPQHKQDDDHDAVISCEGVVSLRISKRPEYFDRCPRALFGLKVKNILHCDAIDPLIGAVNSHDSTGITTSASDPNTFMESALAKQAINMGLPLTPTRRIVSARSLGRYNSPTSRLTSTASAVSTTVGKEDHSVSTINSSNSAVAALSSGTYGISTKRSAAIAAAVAAASTLPPPTPSGTPKHSSQSLSMYHLSPSSFFNSSFNFDINPSSGDVQMSGMAPQIDAQALQRRLSSLAALPEKSDGATGNKRSNHSVLDCVPLKDFVADIEALESTYEKILESVRLIHFNKKQLQCVEADGEVPQALVDTAREHQQLLVLKLELANLHNVRKLAELNTHPSLQNSQIANFNWPPFRFGIEMSNVLDEVGQQARNQESRTLSSERFYYAGSLWCLELKHCHFTDDSPEFVAVYLRRRTIVGFQDSTVLYVNRAVVPEPTPTSSGSSSARATTTSTGNVSEGNPTLNSNTDSSTNTETSSVPPPPATETVVFEDTRDRTMMSFSIRLCGAPGSPTSNSVCGRSIMGKAFGLQFEQSWGWESFVSMSNLTEKPWSSGDKLRFVLNLELL